jgi:putative ABC transport system substrate-binding protein
MRRREFIGLVGGAAATWPMVAQAQQPERIGLIGILGGLPENDPVNQPRYAALLQGLRELGWIEGKRRQLVIVRESQSPTM